jgi:mRNA interferase MazF
VKAHHGEIWLLDFGEPIGREQAGRRPAVIVSDNEMNEGPSGLVIVVPVTSTPRGLPSHVELDGPETGLELVSYAKCEDIKSVSEGRLVVRLGVVPDVAMFSIKRVLRFLLAM